MGVSLLQSTEPPGPPAMNKAPGEGWENPSGSHTAATCRSCSQAGSGGTQPSHAGTWGATKQTASGEADGHLQTLQPGFPAGPDEVETPAPGRCSSRTSSVACV